MIAILPFSKNQIAPQKSEFKPYTTTPCRLKSQPLADEVNFSTLKALDANEVSFGSKNFLIVELSGIPCPYCGRTMVSSLEQKDFGLLVSEAKGQELQKKLMSTFARKKKHFTKDLAESLMIQSRKYPDKTLQDILVAMAPLSEKNLVRTQGHIIDGTRRALKNLTGETKNSALFCLDQAEKALRLKDADEDTCFKRGKLLRGFSELINKETDNANKQHLKKIFKHLLKLPYSETNKDAFVVKYQRRSSREIGEVLIEPYMATKDHLYPDSKGGVSQKHNYIAVDKACNQKRGNKDWLLFLSERPKIRRFLPRSLEVINERIKQGCVPGYGDYLADVSATIYQESRGLMELPYLKGRPSLKIRNKKYLKVATNVQSQEAAKPKPRPPWQNKKNKK